MILYFYIEEWFLQACILSLSIIHLLRYLWYYFLCWRVTPLLESELSQVKKKKIIIRIQTAIPSSFNSSSIGLPSTSVYWFKSQEPPLHGKMMKGMIISKPTLLRDQYRVLTLYTWKSTCLTTVKKNGTVQSDEALMKPASNRICFKLKVGSLLGVK